MKSIMKVLGFVAMIASMGAYGQAKTDEKRMDQDIEVAENILSTLFRQQLGRRNFFPMEVNGHYTAGYGVTFKLPQNLPFNFMMAPPATEEYGPGVVTYRWSSSDMEEERAAMEEDQRQQELMEREQAGERQKQARANEKQARTGRTEAMIAASPRASGERMSSDSVRAMNEKIFLTVAKSFLADYGDVLSQLKPEERIILTNKRDGFDDGFGFAFKMGGFSGRDARSNMMSVEGKRDDILQLKQGKISRDQFLSRLKVIDAESSGKLDPDLEVLSSMFSRLYGEDLSKTYYTQGYVNYERLKDFGVIYYMKVYSSNEEGGEWSLPTVAMRNVSQTDRDKKVKELYPDFESGLKDNMIEYGRTLRSLKDDESLVFNVRLTKCTGCGIPESLELAVKNSVLKDYSSGKITKDAALARVNVKKEGKQ